VLDGEEGKVRRLKLEIKHGNNVLTSIDTPGRVDIVLYECRGSLNTRIVNTFRHRIHTI